MKIRFNVASSEIMQIDDGTRRVFHFDEPAHLRSSPLQRERYGDLMRYTKHLTWLMRTDSDAYDTLFTGTARMPKMKLIAASLRGIGA